VESVPHYGSWSAQIVAGCLCDPLALDSAYSLLAISKFVLGKARTFGETQISRFRDGWLLLKMVWFAYRKLKAI